MIKLKQMKLYKSFECLHKVDRTCVYATTLDFLNEHLPPTATSCSVRIAISLTMTTLVDSAKARKHTTNLSPSLNPDEKQSLSIEIASE